MTKTDKEIASEIICEYIRAWGTQNSCVPVKRNELPGLIKDVYNTVHSLEKSESDEDNLIPP